MAFGSNPKHSPADLVQPSARGAGVSTAQVDATRGDPDRSGRVTARAILRTPPKRSRRMDSADAFVPDPEEGRPIRAADAESFAEEFIATATTGESVEMDALDEIAADEDGGPYLDLDEDVDLPESVGTQHILDVSARRRPGST